MLLPSTWCAAVAAPHRKPAGNRFISDGDLQSIETLTAPSAQQADQREVQRDAKRHADATPSGDGVEGGAADSRRRAEQPCARARQGEQEGDLQGSRELIDQLQGSGIQTERDGSGGAEDGGKTDHRKGAEDESDRKHQGNFLGAKPGRYGGETGESGLT